jgi:ornithine cyclodeaminase/alanine dehydrogenase-like protein (mu-crystallin family)
VPEVLVLGRDEVESLLPPERLFAPLESAFVALSEGRANVPPRIAAETPGGLLAAMPGYVEGLGLAAKLVSVFTANEERGLPVHQAVVALLDAEDGRVLSLMDGTWITAVRTAAASAVALRALARPDARVLAILGAGVQGHAHLSALTAIHDFEEIVVASRDARRAAALAERASNAAVASSFEAAVRAADVVACCTDAHEPILRREWISPGTHVGSVGFGVALDPATVRLARVVVEWRGAVTSPPPAGAADLQGLDASSVSELGEVLSGRRPGREHADEITVYRSVGHAMEDVAAARVAYDLALAQGVGTTVVLD